MATKSWILFSIVLCNIQCLKLIVELWGAKHKKGIHMYVTLRGVIWQKDHYKKKCIPILHDKYNGVTEMVGVISLGSCESTWCMNE